MPDWRNIHIIFRIVTLSLLLLIAPVAESQKVGLVLSGGGAKGCAHIGVIRAMEENGIPIDYIAGTSMGAVVGALYAMGYSPDDMENLLASDEFRTWASGRIDEKSIYYFKRKKPTPEFLSLRMHVTDSFTFKPRFIPRSLIRPTQMNIVFMQLCAQASADCRGNFDSLMIPFRCVASDVNEKKPIVHKNGDLGDAVRSSMSFPLVFLPTEMDGRVLYDGGIYNNFPVNVMQNDFHPDYIVGVSVGDEVTRTNAESNIIEQIESMILNRDETYKSRPDSMLILQFKFKDVGLLDFAKVRDLSQIGYDTMRMHIDEVRQTVHTYIPIDSIIARRAAYRAKLHPLDFRSVWVNGGNPMLCNYVRRNIGGKKGNKFDYKTFHANYFKLLSDDRIDEIRPHTAYNSKDSTFDLMLTVKPGDNFKFGLGGNISSANLNQLYMGIGYQNVFGVPFDAQLDGQIGYFYKCGDVNIRTNFNLNMPFYVSWNTTYHSFSYYDNELVTFSSTQSSYTNAEEEMYTKMKFGFPFMRTAKLELGAGVGITTFNYKGTYTPTTPDHYDESDQKLFVVTALLDKSSYTVKQFPVTGSATRIAFNYITGDCRNGAYGLDSLNEVHKNYTKYGHKSWFQASTNAERFFRLSRHFTIGSFYEALYSTLYFDKKDIESIIRMPAFQPTIHSMSTFNPYLRSDAYGAIGLTPIYRINDQIHLRFQNYLYAPLSYFKWYPKDNKTINEYNKLVYMSEVSLVAQFNFLTISIYSNYYNHPNNDFNYGLNIGFLIPNTRLIER